LEQVRLKILPKDLIALLDAYGPLNAGELRRFLQFLDDSVLKIYLNKAIYSTIIAELQDYLEENL